MKVVHRTDYPRGQSGTFCFQQNKFGKKTADVSNNIQLISAESHATIEKGTHNNR